MIDTKNNEDYKIFVDFMDELADAAAKVTLKYFRKPLEVINKGPKLGTDFDPVTIADQNTEKMILKLMSSRFPTHNIMGEEQSDETNNDSIYTWVIDPIDGTRAFITGIPTWGTLVAMHDGEKPVIGMLDQPYLNERFIGTPSGSFLNGKIIKCRPCSDISVATLSTTDPQRLFATNDEKTAFDQVAAKAKLVRNGFDCYAYAMIATGFIDVVIESGLEPYDIQALIPIIEGAGGIVSNWQGEHAHQGGQILACGDKRLHKQVIEILNHTN